MKTKRGYTLIELLVVIGTVAVLAALLLGGVARAHGRAWRLQCANNVRQIDLALQAFVADNNSYVLFVDPPQGVWVSVLQHTELSTATNHVNFSRYTSEGVWKCPAAAKPANWPRLTGYVSYGYNGYGLFRPTDVDSLGLGGHNIWNPPHNLAATNFPAPAVKESEVVNPGGMMAIGDGFYGGGGIIEDGALVLGRTTGLPDRFGSTKRSYQRHQGTANVAFCDGHVESPKLKFMFESTGDDALRHWNRDDLAHRERL
jgi:prepilin-type processing-associated H-X9-DG protein/prepilin-type N-terminal cleavage/methylation domain-containing protein